MGWDKIPRYPFDKPGEVEGQLAKKFVLPFYTVNKFVLHAKSSDPRISYNLVAVGVLL